MLISLEAEPRGSRDSLQLARQLGGGETGKRPPWHPVVLTTSNPGTILGAIKLSSLTQADRTQGLQ